MKRMSAVLGAAALAAMTFAGAAQAQSKAGTPAPTPAQGSPQMMAQRQQMMAEMQAAQKKLDELVAQMNAATGNAKVDRIAAVLTELVAQHKRMSTMMQGGMMMSNPPSTATPAPPTGEKPGVDHSQHHE